jgi:hypothetical protein
MDPHFQQALVLAKENRSLYLFNNDKSKLGLLGAIGVLALLAVPLVGVFAKVLLAALGGFCFGSVVNFKERKQ